MSASTTTSHLYLRRAAPVGVLFAGICVVSAGATGLAGLVIAVYSLFARMKTAIGVFLVLSVYRLPSPHKSLFGFNVDVSKAGLLLLLLTCLLHYRPLLRRATPLQWVLALGATQAAADLVSTGLSVAPRRAIGEAAFSLASAIAVVVVARWLTELDGNERLEWLGRALVVCSMLAAAQAYVLQSIGSQATTLYAPTTSGVVVRIAGLAGGFLPGMLLIGLAIVFVARGRVTGKRLADGAVAVALLVTIYLTFTRGAYIDVAVIGFLALWRTVQLRGIWLTVAAWIVAIIALALAAGGAHIAAVARFQELGSSGNTLSTRYLLWHSAIHLWAQNPLTGLGAGSYNAGLKMFYAGRLPVAYYAIYSYPEQQLLGLLSETGVIGLLSYLASMMYLTVHGLRLVHSRAIKSLPRRQLYLTAAVVINAGRIVSELLGTWLSGNQWLLLPVAILLAYVPFSRRDTRNATHATRLRPSYVDSR